MSTSATRQYQYTRIASLHRLDIIVELPHGLRMLQHVAVLRRRPLHIVLTYAAPFKSRVPRWRIAEVVHLVSRLPQFLHHLRVIPVTPAAGNIYLSFHIWAQRYELKGITQNNRKSFCVTLGIFKITFGVIEDTFGVLTPS